MPFVACNIYMICACNQVKQRQKQTLWPFRTRTVVFPLALSLWVMALCKTRRSQLEAYLMWALGGVGVGRGVRYRHHCTCGFIHRENSPIPHSIRLWKGPVKASTFSGREISFFCRASSHDSMVVQVIGQGQFKRRVSLTAVSGAETSLES